MQYRIAKRQLIIGVCLMSISVVAGSIQVIFSTLPFIRGISIIAVIACSGAAGAFIREMFVLKEKKQALEK